MGSPVFEPGPQRRSARPPGGKAVGITLAPGPARLAALAIVGVPFVILMIIGLKTASWGVGLPVPALLDGTGGGQAPPPAAQSPTGVSGSPYSQYPSASPGYGSSAAATPGDFGTPTPSAALTTSSAASVVRKAYRAINQHDYRLAYSLGLAAAGQSYADFAAGYQGTASVTLTVESTQGNTVMVTLTATQQDGIQQLYSGTYTVSGGHITSAQIQPAG
jgi:hypothetical protein